MKVYVVTDLEGVAGVTEWDPRHQEGDEPAATVARTRYSRWLTEEVNAATRGFFAGGTTEVIVNDGHGAGNTIDPELLDPRVQLFHGTGRPDYCTGLDETCDAIASLGTHAMGGTPHGNLAHTMGKGIRLYSINGVPVGESGYQAFLAGYFGVPFIFCAGDEWAVREMQQLCPGCVGAATKFGTSALSALTATPARACEIIEEGARRSMDAIGRVKPLEAGSPVVFREEFHAPTFDAEQQQRPGFTVVGGHTCEVTAKNMQELMTVKYNFDPDWRPIWRQQQG
jgi:D-amino peptidase